MALGTLSFRSRARGVMPEDLPSALRVRGEIEWIVSGVVPETAALAEAVGPGHAERISEGALLLRFGNSVGRFAVGRLGTLFVPCGKWGEDVAVYYNLTFSQAHHDARRSASLQLRPDVVVRVRAGAVDTMHVLDAKLRIEPSGSAGLEQDESGEPPAWREAGGRARAPRRRRALRAPAIGPSCHCLYFGCARGVCSWAGSPRSFASRTRRFGNRHRPR